MLKPIAVADPKSGLFSTGIVLPDGSIDTKLVRKYGKAKRFENANAAEAYGSEIVREITKLSKAGKAGFLYALGIVLLAFAIFEFLPAPYNFIGLVVAVIGLKIALIAAQAAEARSILRQSETSSMKGADQ